MRRILWALAGVCIAGPAVAAVPFDPDEATRAWLATIGPEATARSNAYFEGGYWLDVAETVIAVLIGVALLFLGWVRGARDWFERTAKVFPLVVLGTAVVYQLISGVASLPFRYYRAFVREHEFGLSRQTAAEWFSETAVQFLIGLIIGSIVITVLYLIVSAARRTWWIWGSLATVMMFMFVAFAAPVLIAPRFNNYQPMAESPLKRDILTMAQANGVPADNVYTFDTSRQSNRITANVSGLFGTTRISLGDNLVERASPGAVRAVMGHELGHYVLGQMVSIIVMNGMLIALIFALLNWSFLLLSRNERWGIRGIADPAGMPLVFALIAVIGLIVSPISNNITRYHEQQADMFGLNVAREPDGFAEASVLLSEYRKMHPSPLEEFLFYDHPSGWARIHNSMVWKAHEIEAGRLPATPGGPPPGWRPDFVVMQREGAPAP